MAITYKCKMCGGNLELTEGSPLAVCEYCGTQQTVPTADNEKKMTLFARAGRLLRACEFDKAAGVYESIVAEFPEEAEAYWGLVLCRYGIEYVDDPATGKKIPTCHRSSFDSVMQDSDFEQALENADPISRKVYRSEAKTMEDLRRGIIEVSGKEEPYDIFICYKETDDNGERTLDSVLAQDVYDALTEKGYRVFFSRISLEDKLGMEYEPYIFAALNSAKVMLAFGTDYEYYNAVWVKNEWSRFLALMARGEKKTLIPCYKNLDAYDMPKEFAKLQAQDMGKVGAVQDLLRGIEKILSNGKEKETESIVVEQVQSVAAPGVESLYTRAMLFLEDRDWSRAEEYFNRALDIDPKNAACYLGLAMVDYQVSDYESFVPKYVDSQRENRNFDKFQRYTDSAEEKLRIENTKMLFVKETERRKEERRKEEERKEEERRREEERREEERRREEELKEEARKREEARRREEERRKEKERRREEERKKEEIQRKEMEDRIEREIQNKKDEKNKKIKKSLVIATIAIHTILLALSIVGANLNKVRTLDNGVFWIFLIGWGISFIFWFQASKNHQYNTHNAHQYMLSLIHTAILFVFLFSALISDCNLYFVLFLCTFSIIWGMIHWLKVGYDKDGCLFWGAELLTIVAIALSLSFFLNI